MSEDRETKVSFTNDNEVTIHGHVIGGDLRVMPPSPELGEEQLVRALEKNRSDLYKYEEKISSLVSDNHDITSEQMNGAVKNALASYKSIVLLIPAIKLRGGDAEYTDHEAKSIETILNDAYDRGLKIRQQVEEEQRRQEAEKQQLEMIKRQADERRRRIAQEESERESKLYCIGCLLLVIIIISLVAYFAFR